MAPQPISEIVVCERLFRSEGLYPQARNTPEVIAVIGEHGQAVPERLIRNGEEIASSTFMVTAFDRDFLSDAEGMCTIANFPDMGQNATFVWETSQQGLVLESVN